MFFSDCSWLNFYVSHAPLALYYLETKTKEKNLLKSKKQFCAKTFRWKCILKKIPQLQFKHVDNNRNINFKNLVLMLQNIFPTWAKFCYLESIWVVTIDYPSFRSEFIFVSTIIFFGQNEFFMVPQKKSEGLYCEQNKVNPKTFFYRGFLCRIFFQWILFYY